MPRTLSLLAALAFASPVMAQVQITEWMYDGNNLEFVEFTNIGTSAVDFTGWSYSDDKRIVGAYSLSSFGAVAAGESVIFTEAAPTAFRAAWNLATTVKVVGPNANNGSMSNLGRNDEINLYNASGGLVDRLTYGDQNFPGTIRTQTSSGTPANLNALASTTVTANNWVLSVTGDLYGSRLSTGGDVGNPGVFALSQVSAVPEPASLAMLLAGLGFVGAAVSRKRG